MMAEVRIRKFIGTSERRLPKECEDCGAPKSSYMGVRCVWCSQEVHNIRMSEKHRRKRELERMEHDEPRERSSG